MIATDSANLDLMTTREAAAYLRIGRETLAKLAREGQIPTTKLAGRWRFSKSLLDDWLRNQMRTNCHLTELELRRPGLFSAIRRLLSRGQKVERPEVARMPQCIRVSSHDEVPIIRSRIQQEIIRLIGQDGLGRSWRIVDPIAKAGFVHNKRARGLPALAGRGMVLPLSCDLGELAQIEQLC
jgi:excisionase family DNA binding protein